MSDQMKAYGAISESCQGSDHLSAKQVEFDFDLKTKVFQVAEFFFLGNLIAKPLTKCPH